MADPFDEKANDALVRAFVEAWEGRDIDVIFHSLTDDVIYHAVPLTPIVGKAAVTAWVRSFEGKPPGRLHVHRQVASGDVVMNERTDTIVLNGRTVALPISAVFEMRRGRIHGWREYFDLAPAKAAYA